MVEAVRRGRSLREVARRFQVSHSTVLVWLGRAGDERLSRVDWSDRPRGPHRPANRTPAATEELVVAVRRELARESALGEFGARAIRETLCQRGREPLPSVRTIGRILDRRGALDGRQRRRHVAPPRGWHLPDLARRTVESDSFDVVEDLTIRGGIDVNVLTGISLFGSLAGAWPKRRISAENVVEELISHWRAVGLPGYAQFDNDTRFQGPHQHRDVVGRVTRLCLSLGVTPVFVPPQETGFQAAIEHFNGRWQRAVWRRFRHRSRAELVRRSDAFVNAWRGRQAERIESAPRRRRFPKGWRFDPAAALAGRIVYLRRLDEAGRAHLLGRRFDVDRAWAHRLVRAEMDVTAERLRFYALRRREPDRQPLLKEVHHALRK